MREKEVNEMPQARVKEREIDWMHQVEPSLDCGHCPHWLGPDRMLHTSFLQQIAPILLGRVSRRVIASSPMTKPR